MGRFHIHEMIHYYIGVNGIKDTSAHGQIFRQMMETTNQRFGRKLTISHRSTPEQKELILAVDEYTFIHYDSNRDNPVRF